MSPSSYVYAFDLAVALSNATDGEYAPTGEALDWLHSWVLARWDHERFDGNWRTEEGFTKAARDLLDRIHDAGDKLTELASAEGVLTPGVLAEFEKHLQEPT